MNVGDKVRLLTDNEEGVISKIIDEKTVEVEIEDGFQIPVLKGEVVIISKSEARYFGNDSAGAIGNQESPSSQAAKGEATSGKGRTSKFRAVLSAKGIYLAFVPLNDENVAVYLVNNTDYTLPYSVAEEKVRDLHGVDAGVLQAGGHKKLKERTLSSFEKWPDIIIQWLFHRHGIFSMKQPTFKRFKAKASTFYRNKRRTPILEKEAYLFQIDQDKAVKDVSPDQIKEAMMAPKPSLPQAEPTTFGGPQETLVDLHIEALVASTKGMSNGEMMEVQLRRFDEALDRAIAQGNDHITFIHGVGNGTLRDVIHKRLSNIDHIRHFEDAMKEKFGFGATRVQIS